MDSVQLYGNSLEVQLTYYEQRVSDLQRGLDRLAWWNIPQSIVSELGHVSDNVLDLLGEAQLEFRRTHFVKAQQLLNQVAIKLEQFSHLMAIGSKLSVLKPKLEQLIEYKIDHYSSLVSYRRTLLRKFSVAVGMVRGNYDTVSWQLEEIQHGLDELEASVKELPRPEKSRSPNFTMKTARAFQAG